MIYLGVNSDQKDGMINQYCKEHSIKKVFILSPEKFFFKAGMGEVIEYRNIIEYAYYYRLLQEIDAHTLVVVNECLRTQNRYELTYNCIRNFLNQTSHQIIFQYLPCIDMLDDFMILFDFDTRSRWKREKFNAALLSESEITVIEKPISFTRTMIETSDALKGRYEIEKERLFNNLGLKDPHTIPRNLYMLAGREKAKAVKEDGHYIGRNDRLKITGMSTYKENKYDNADYIVFEFCHNFIDFCDFIALTGQASFDVLSVDLKVEDWYFNRYREWSERIADAYTKIRQSQNRS